MGAEGAPGAALETERMVLRELVPEDVESLMLIFSDPEAMRYYPSAKTREEAARWIDRFAESYEENGFGTWPACSRRRASSADNAGSYCRRLRVGRSWRSATCS
jgi:RimJ/RimL family protein N-acetyltransferase